MTNTEKQLLESVRDMSADELISLIDSNDIRNFSEEYQN